MAMTASTLKPNPPAVPLSPSKAPGVLYALGLVLLYFLLQIAAALLMGLAAGLLEKIRHPHYSLADLHQHVTAVLQQADSNAVLMIVALPLIALLLFWLVRRQWPPLWHQAEPPGFGFNAPTASRWYVTALLAGVVMPPLGALITQLLAHGHDVTQNVQELSEHASRNLRLPFAIVAVTVGPMIEELLFRGVLLSALMRRMSTAFSVAICVVLFGAVHLAGLAFQWYALPNLMLLAAVLCWLRLKSGSLWPAILAHGLYNLFALVALFVAA
jgi:membrane protease YdiL (CAAX protease family)